MFYLRYMILCLVFVGGVIAKPAAPSLSKSTPPSFSVFIQGVKEEALAAGISEKTVTLAFKGIKKPMKRAVTLSKSQPEFKENFDTYYHKRANLLAKKAVAKSVALKLLLKKLEAKYHVDTAVLLALWGIESHFGRYIGTLSTVQALATMAYTSKRRAGFFRRELLMALKILDEGHVSASGFKGSWAGAMGQCQFMPSSYLAYAVDEDGDGKKDIWHAEPDILASIANYLKQNHWVFQQPVCHEVELRDQDLEGGKQLARGISYVQPVSVWKSQGVHLPKTAKVSGEEMAALIEVPGKTPSKPHLFLVYENFKNILKWNRSYLFALAVGQLANDIQEKTGHHE